MNIFTIFNFLDVPVAVVLKMKVSLQSILRRCGVNVD